MKCMVQPSKKRNKAMKSRPQPDRRTPGRAGHALQAKADQSASVHRLSALQRMADSGAQNAPVLQAFAETAADDPPQWRLSDSRKSGVPQDKSGGGSALYATPEIIKDGDDKLLAASSAIGLTQTADLMELEGNDIYRVAPYLREKAIADVDHDRTKKLKEINTGEKPDDMGVTDDDMLAMWTDCGKVARTIMGAQDTGRTPKATTNIGDSKASNSPEAYSNEMFPKAIKAFYGSDVSEGHLTKGVHYRSIGPFSWFIKPRSGKSARRMYYALGEEGRTAFDKHVGINRYANPEIGGAYTMVTQKDMPGFASSGKTWNFHWGGVVAKDGADNVTLESYAVSAANNIREAKETMSGKELAAEIKRLREWAADFVDRSWAFQMYGTKAEDGQTFHDEHLASGTHGNRATTFSAKP
ncbi:hypothetical protein SAMN05443635_11278 [Roseobacter denitrificans OCh 114]|nr:hypothetical protein [Roseobacter denitrificans]SFG30355.1 hypothetical protein SAMN05443635_11278 [Roseobacter denitrificans OCh 114]